MLKAISLHSIIPVRAEARESAEQNTQMLFGETCQIFSPLSEASPLNNSSLSKWTHVRLDSDGQEGWVDTKMLSPITSAEYKSYREAYAHAAQIVFPMAYAVSENNGQTIPLTAGTRLTNYKDGRFSLLGVSFRIDPNMVITQPLELNEQNLMQTVRFFLNVPYLWGGKNALGMDCSGFVQTVMGLFGKRLLRNASEQATQGRAIKFENARVGDLVFFNHGEGPVSHVGIILSPLNSKLSPLNWTVVHCSGRVKVDKLDKKGIISHQLVAIRRV